VTRQAEWTKSELPGAAPSSPKGEGSPRWHFRVLSHGVGSGCPRFATVVTHAPRKTRLRLLARLYRTGLASRRIRVDEFRAWGCSAYLSFLTLWTSALIPADCFPWSGKASGMRWCLAMSLSRNAVQLAGARPWHARGLNFLIPFITPCPAAI